MALGVSQVAMLRDGVETANAALSLVSRLQPTNGRIHANRGVHHIRITEPLLAVRYFFWKCRKYISASVDQ